MYDKQFPILLDLPSGPVIIMQAATMYLLVVLGRKVVVVLRR